MHRGILLERYTLYQKLKSDTHTKTQHSLLEAIDNNKQLEH
jgi:hypothetical protein